MSERVKNPKTPSGKAFVTHTKSIDAVARELKKKGWYPLPFIKINKKWKYMPEHGIVDLIAIRLRPTKIKKKMDKLQIVLFQLKAGSAREPTLNQRRRLEEAVKMIEIGYDYIRYKNGKVKFRWEPEEFLNKIRLK